MLFRVVTLSLLVFGLNSLAEARFRTIPYEYALSAENDVLSGHIAHDAEKGTKVMADVVEITEGEIIEDREEFLKVIISTSRNQKFKSTPPAELTSTHQRITQANPITLSHSGQTFTARMTGSPNTRQSGSSKDTTTADEQNAMWTSEDVTVVTTNTRPEPRSQTGSTHSVHITNSATKPESGSGSSGHMSGSRRGIHPHGHSIHITHLAKDSVHPLVNKRSVNDEYVAARKKRSVFAISHDFQPEHLREPSPAGTQNLLIVVMDTNTFYVDPLDHYVKVNTTDHLRNSNVNIIEFYVYLADENGVAVSNPLPFIIYIDRPEVDTSSYPAVPAVFAGVLVLCVIFFAVVIPLVTRAKRRYREGKPMFKLGSHPSRADLENVGFEEQMRRKASEPNWYGNNAYYSYDEEVAKEQSEFSAGLKKYSKRGNQPTLQPHKKEKETLSEKSSSSGVDVSSQAGAEGVDGEDAYSQRL